MGKSTRLTTAAVLAAGAAIVIAVFIAGSRDGDSDAAAAELPPRSISVSGHGEVLIAPDVAVLNVGVSVLAATVAQAREQAAGSMQKVIDALKANGVVDQDIQTTAFSIQPEYDYGDGKTTLRGFRVFNSVVAKIRNLDAAGKTIDDAATAGGNDAVIGGITFTVEDTKGAVKQARELAMRDARDKAEQLATLGSVALGDPLQISESGGTTPPVEYGGGPSAAPDTKTPVQPGRLAVSVDVSVVYGMK